MTYDPSSPPWNADTGFAEVYDPIFEITTEDEARAHFERIVAYSMEFAGLTREEAEAMARANIGYYAGRQERSRARIERLYDCQHPILGKATDAPPNTAERLLRLGKLHALRKTALRALPRGPR